MKKSIENLFLAFSIIILLGLAAGQAGAYTVDITYGSNGNELVSTASLTGATTINFDSSLPAGVSISGDYAIVTGTNSSHSAPYGVSSKDDSSYLTVPGSGGSGSATVTLSSDYDYLGLWWGSVDHYNHLYLYNNGTLVATINGQDILNQTGGSTGNQTSSLTNLYLNVSGVTFDRIVLNSTQRAFEVDNITVGSAVPIPAAAWLLGTGLVGLVGIRRRMGH